MQAFLTILRTDNEEVSVVTLKIITDLHKNYKNVLEEHVQPFLDIVKEMFGNMESAINENFGEESASVSIICFRFLSFYLFYYLVTTFPQHTIKWQPSNNNRRPAIH